MDVPLRTDILLVAVVAQIPVRFLHLLDKRLCVIRRDIVRNEDFRQLVVANLLQNTSQGLLQIFTAVIGNEGNGKKRRCLLPFCAYPFQSLFPRCRQPLPSLRRKGCDNARRAPFGDTIGRNVCFYRASRAHDAAAADVHSAPDQHVLFDAHTALDLDAALCRDDCTIFE